MSPPGGAPEKGLDSDTGGSPTGPVFWLFYLVVYLEVSVKGCAASGLSVVVVYCEVPGLLFCWFPPLPPLFSALPLLVLPPDDEPQNKGVCRGMRFHIMSVFAVEDIVFSLSVCMHVRCCIYCALPNKHMCLVNSPVHIGRYMSFPQKRSFIFRPPQRERERDREKSRNPQQAGRKSSPSGRSSARRSNQAVREWVSGVCVSICLSEFRHCCFAASLFSLLLLFLEVGQPWISHPPPPPLLVRPKPRLLLKQAFWRGVASAGPPFGRMLRGGPSHHHMSASDGEGGWRARDIYAVLQQGSRAEEREESSNYCT